MAKKVDQPKAPERIAPTATEISVARNGFLKPYAVCFQHLPDNIAREPLGMFAGVMAINDRSEHSAYIVNFVSSIAKKEYYGNSKRNAIESFEASLHKVNIGLSEIAKEGNTEWIGEFDAAICVVERNNLHFSVAGNAKVLLFRDQRLSDISEGLSDSGDQHPIKTFTDVASGKISPGDRILVTTPGILSILPESELERSANRLPEDQFEQFLQTATINRLDLSASVLITIGAVAEYERKPAPKRTLATVDSVPNAWSHAVFESAKQLGSSVSDSLRLQEKETGTPSAISERIDDKTGHIYITGESPKESPNETWEHFRFLLEEASTALRHTSARLFRWACSLATIGLRNVHASAKRIASKTAEKVRVQKRESSVSQTIPKTIIESPSDEETREREDTPPLESVPSTREESGIQAILASIVRLLGKIREGIASMLSKRNETIRNASPARWRTLLQKGALLLDSLLRKFDSLRRAFRRLPDKRQRVIKIAGIALLCGLAAIFFSHIFTSGKLEDNASARTTKSEAHPTVENSADSSDLGNNRQHSLGEIPLFATIPNIVNIVQLGETAFFVTKDAICTTDSNGKNPVLTTYPDGAVARMGIAMPDLNAILILTTTGNILFFTPSNNRFADERFQLPDADTATRIATSSTYLYVLDQTKNTLMRYPRAEGGFGTATKWFREPVSIMPGTSLAVSDSVFIADGSGIHTYFRGTKKDVTFETPSSPLSPTDMTAVSSGGDSGSLFVLDGTTGKIIQYDASSGSILAQYESSTLRKATLISVDRNARKAFVSAGDSVFSIELK